MPMNECEKSCYHGMEDCTATYGAISCLFGLIIWIPFHLVWDLSMVVLMSSIALPFVVLGFGIPSLVVEVVFYFYETLKLPYVILKSGMFGWELKLLLLLLQPVFSIVRLVLTVLAGVLGVVLQSAYVGLASHMNSPLRPWVSLWTIFYPQSQRGSTWLHERNVLLDSFNLTISFFEMRNNPEAYDRIKDHPGPPIRFPILQGIASIPLAVVLTGLTVIPTTVVTAVHTAIVLPLSALPYALALPLIRGWLEQNAFAFFCMLPFYYIALALGVVVWAIAVPFMFVACQLVTFLRTFRYVLSGELFTMKPFWNMMFVTSSYYKFSCEMNRFILCVAFFEDAGGGRNDACSFLQFFGEPDSERWGQLADAAGFDIETAVNMVGDRGGPVAAVQVVVGNEFEEDEDRNPMRMSRNVGPPPGRLERQTTADEPIYKEYFHGLVRLPNDRRLGTTTVWNSFFNQSFTLGADALAKGIISKEEIEDQDPFLFLGLPAAVMYAGLERSVELGAKGIVLAKGLEVTEENRPFGNASNIFWGPCMRIKELIKAANLEKNEKGFIRKALLRQHNEDQDLATIDESRLKVLNEIIGSTNSMAIRMSRLMKFSSRFREVLSMLTEANTGAGKDDEEVAGTDGSLSVGLSVETAQ